MNKIFKNLGLFLILLVLCFPATFIFAWIYRFFYESGSTDAFFNLVGGSFWGPSSSIIAGFLMSLLFFLSFYFSATLKIIYSLILLVILNLLVLFIFKGIWMEDIVILIASSVFGYLLAELIKFLYNKFKK